MKKSFKIASISMLLSLCLANAACDNKDAAKTESTSEVKVEETNKETAPAATNATPADATDANKADATKTDATKTETTTKTETK